MTCNRFGSEVRAGLATLIVAFVSGRRRAGSYYNLLVFMVVIGVVREVLKGDLTQRGGI